MSRVLRGRDGGGLSLSRYCIIKFYFIIAIYIYIFSNLTKKKKLLVEHTSSWTLQSISALLDSKFKGHFHFSSLLPHFTFSQQPILYGFVSWLLHWDYSYYGQQWHLLPCYRTAGSDIRSLAQTPTGQWVGVGGGEIYHRSGNSGILSS